MNRESVLSQFEMLLPLAAAWATEQEKKIQRDGITLSEHEFPDACSVGVREPQRIRLLRVQTGPLTWCLSSRPRRLRWKVPTLTRCT